MRATIARTAAQVTAVGARALLPVAGLGGGVRRKRSVHRAFLLGGCYIFAGYDTRHVAINDQLVKDLIGLAARAGWRSMVANKPAVMLTLAGDEKRLTDAFHRVGQASQTMTANVTDSSKQAALGSR